MLFSTLDKAISFQLEQLVVEKSDWPAVNATDRSFAQSPYSLFFSRWTKIEIYKHAVCTPIIKGSHRHQLLLEHHRHTNARVQMLTAAEVTCWSYWALCRAEAEVQNPLWFTLQHLFHCYPTTHFISSRSGRFLVSPSSPSASSSTLLPLSGDCGSVPWEQGLVS